MQKHGQSSIWDSLISIMPEFRDRIRKNPDYINPVAAKSLYNIWRTGSSHSQKNKVFKRPATLGQDEISRMKEEGLVTAIGDDLQITSKGQKIIKVMILGDDRSIFEDDGNILEYNKALSCTKGIKVAKQRKIASNFWEQFEKEE